VPLADHGNVSESVDCNMKLMCYYMGESKARSKAKHYETCRGGKFSWLCARSGATQRQHAPLDRVLVPWCSSHFPFSVLSLLKA